jgi:23S rRNA (uracil1939-C5)-methyltransferase
MDKRFSKGRSPGFQRDRVEQTDPAARGPYRPPCPHYPNCIGCPFINLPYPEQLVRKQARVADAFGKFDSLNKIEIPAVVPSPRRLGYRARVKLVVRKNSGAIATGLYVPQTHRVMDISSCPVHPRRVNQVLEYLKSRASELGMAPYDERDDSGDLRYIDFRYSFARQEVSVTLVSRHPVLPEGEKLARALQRKFSFVTGVILNINENRGNVIWGQVNRMLSGRESLMEQIGGLKLVYPAGVFSQSNPNTAQKLYDRVNQLAELTGKEAVLDLYCGVGPISLNLAPGARQVWGIDDNEAGIITAKQNARRNGVGNCRFFAGDAAAKIEELRAQLSGVDLIVMNPPRKGLQPAALAAVLELRASTMIYVSCEPASLARDLDKLVAAGYRIQAVQPFDMFPQTEQVETVVQLARNLPAQ